MNAKKKIEKQFNEHNPGTDPRPKIIKEYKKSTKEPKAKISDEDYNRDITLYKKKDQPKTYDEEFPPFS